MSAAAASPSLSGTISRLEGNAIVIGKDSLFINNADVTGVKVFDEVDYEKEGPNLKKVTKKASTSTVSKETKSGGGKITQIDPSKPYLEYSFFYQGSPVSSKFYNFTESVKQKLSQFNVGDEISVSFSKVGDKKTLEDIGPKQAKKEGDLEDTNQIPLSILSGIFQYSMRQFSIKQRSGLNLHTSTN